MQTFMSISVSIYIDTDILIYIKIHKDTPQIAANGGNPWGKEVVMGEKGKSSVANPKVAYPVTFPASPLLVNIILLGEQRDES